MGRAMRYVAFARRRPRRAAPAALALAGALGLGGCGCDAVGYPAVEVTLQDRATGRPVQFGGTEFAYERGGQGARVDLVSEAYPLPAFSICCSSGEWRVRITRAGYAPLDTTVRVRSTGRCEGPVLVRLLARLQPLTAAARSAGRGTLGLTPR